MEVVMGKCFPLDYDFTPAPVVKNIIYKNNDGSAVIKTISEVVITPSNTNSKDNSSVNKNNNNSSNDNNNNNYNNRWVSSVQHQNKFDAEKTLSAETHDVLSRSNADIIQYQNKLAAQRKLSAESNEMMYIPKVSTVQRQNKLDAQKMPSYDIHEALNRPQADITHHRSKVGPQKSMSVESHNELNKPISTVVITTSAKTSTQGKDDRKHENVPPKMTPDTEQGDHKTKQRKASTIDAEEIKRISTANSPRFRVKHRKESLKTPDLTGREAWEETQKKKSQLREEFFRVPYEECNREALRGMLGRLNKSEPRLNTLGKEHKKRNSLTDKRRVHFNMDDSQLEDIRRWREERRMQATPQCIKTVARIYSIDSPPDNQKHIGTINSFSTPKAEMPMVVSIMDSPPLSTKTAKPTDLDSLQGSFAKQKDSGNNHTATNMTPKNDTKKQLAGDKKSFMSPSDFGMPILPGNAVQSGVPPSQSYMSSILGHPTSLPGQSGPQQMLISRPHSNETVHRVPNSSWSSQKSPQNLQSQTQSVLSQKPQLVSTELQHQQADEIAQPARISARNPYPQALQPVPLPRSRSLSANPDASLHESLSESQQPQFHSVKPIASISYPSRRATSLDRAYRLQRPVYSAENDYPYEEYSTDADNPLKSPSLILNHMRSPVPTSSFTETFTPVTVQNKPNSVATTATASGSSPHKSSNILPNQVPTPLNQDLIQRNATTIPQSLTNIQQNPVGIIRSYTYPNREQVNATTSKNLRYSNDNTTSNSTKPPPRPETQKHHHPTSNSVNKNTTSTKPKTPNSASSTSTHSNKKSAQPTGMAGPEPHSQALPGMRGDSVKILMTKGESYAKHHILLNSQMNSMSPRVTVKKFAVTDASQLTSSAPLVTPPASSAPTGKSAHSSTPTRSAPSPTPSCASSHCSFSSSGSSSGCYSGSPSPTPTPSPTRVRTSCVPTDL